MGGKPTIFGNIQMKLGVVYRHIQYWLLKHFPRNWVYTCHVCRYTRVFNIISSPLKTWNNHPDQGFRVHVIHDRWVWMKKNLQNVVDCCVSLFGKLWFHRGSEPTRLPHVGQTWTCSESFLKLDVYPEKGCLWERSIISASSAHWMVANVEIPETETEPSWVGLSLKKPSFFLTKIVQILVGPPPPSKSATWPNFAYF